MVETEHWVSVVPYWAVWPYETMLIPKRHVLRIQDLDDAERNGRRQQNRMMIHSRKALMNCLFLIVRSGCNHEAAVNEIRQLI